MAEPSEDKGFLTQKLEEDRRKMAIEASELREELNIAQRLRMSVRQYPWGWIMGAVVTGFLISRLPARKKEVYLWADPVERKPGRKIPVRKVKADHPNRDNSLFRDQLWPLAKPILTTYLGRKLYERIS